MNASFFSSKGDFDEKVVHFFKFVSLKVIEQLKYYS